MRQFAGALKRDWVPTNVNKRTLQGLTAFFGAPVGGFAIWALFGWEARCKDPVEEALEGALCEKVTVLGMEPSLSPVGAGIVAFVIAAVLVVISEFLLDGSSES